MMTLIETIRRLKHAVSGRADYVTYGGAILPPPMLRKCSPKFRDDEYFLQSAKRDAQILIDDFGVGRASTILDIGCGPGRLAIGILSVMECDYTGVDVQLASIRWCKRTR